MNVSVSIAGVACGVWRVASCVVIRAPCGSSIPYPLSMNFLRKNETGGVEVPPESGVDAIVSHVVEEAGQRILRVEIGYAGGDGSIKTLRKFYRFQVSNPLIINASTFRSSDASCFVSITLENDKEESKGGLTICQAQFEATEGLVAERVPNTKAQQATKTGACMYDSCGHLEAGQTFRYLFRVSVKPNFITRGIAAGDELGKVVFSWRKSGGELGRLASAPIFSPSLSPFLDPDRLAAAFQGGENPFVVHCKGKSGLSVDIASAAARRLTNQLVERNSLDQALPVTVEPINPPARMELGVPTKIQFLVINHSERDIVVQLQFRLDHSKGIAVCGTSFINLQEIHGRGGSATAILSFVPLACGHLRIDGCTIVDMIRGISIPQPTLCEVVVEKRQLNQ